MLLEITIDGDLKGMWSNQQLGSLQPCVAVKCFQRELILVDAHLKDLQESFAL